MQKCLTAREEASHVEEEKERSNPIAARSESHFNDDSSLSGPVCMINLQRRSEDVMWKGCKSHL